MQFICRYGTEDGKVHKKVINADSREAAITVLKRENTIVYDVSRKRSIPVLDRLRQGKIKREEFFVFLREFLALIRAGLPLIQSLDLLIRNRKEGRFLDVLKEIREQVKGGGSLAESFRSHRDFSPMFTSLVETGEKSGELPAVLEQYLNYAEMFDELRRKLYSALIYPALLVVLSVVLIVIMLTYVIPKFSAFYTDSSAKLPIITRGLIVFSNIITDYFFLVLIVIIGVVAAFLYWKETESGRLKLDRFKLRLPLVGRVRYKYSINQFSRSLSVMLKAGVPLLASLDVSMKTITNKWISSKLEESIPEVNEGEALYSSLDRTEVMPPMAIEMIEVGEQTGSLEEMLDQLSSYFDRDIKLAIDRLLRLLEPIFLLTMGLVIALMLLAMYLPIFRAGAMIE